MTLTETEHLLLCYMSTEDAPFMLRLLNMPSYYRFIGDRGVRTVEQAEGYIRDRTLKAYAQFGFGYYIVRLKNSEEAIGMVGLMKREGLEHVDIGFAFLEDQVGKGYGYEAASALMEWGRHNKDIKIYTGIVQDDNPASIRLLEKLGLRFTNKVVLDGEELLLYEEPEIVIN